MIPIMRAAVSPENDHVFACMMSQGGKSQGLFNIIGQRLDDDPAPILYIGPTKNNISKAIEPKVDDMLRSTPSLWRKTTKGKKYTTFSKLISGVPLRFAWAGSSTEIRADSAALVLVDELDAIERDIQGEGNIIELADARHSDYPDGKTIGVSTPTEGNVDTYIHPDTGLEHWKVADPEQVRSPIWQWWQQGTRHEWSWPCPDCGDYFIPRFKLLWWPDGATEREAKKDAKLTCPHCGSVIDTKHKSTMNARGVYVSPGQSVTKDGEAIGEGVDSPDATFWVSGVASFSAKKTFGFLAAKWIAAVRSGDPERIKGVLNTQFGECFKFGGDAPEWETVWNLREEYMSLSSAVRVVLAAVDVQKDRLVYTVRGWGPAMESWLIEAGELWGATDKPSVWKDLDELLDKEFDGQRIRLMLVDSGYRADEVYAFCREHKGRAAPTKGHNEQSKPYYASKIDVNYKGKVIKNGLQLWHFDSDYMKSWVHARVERDSDEPGAWHVNENATEDYCRQIVSEQRVVKPSGKVTWIKTGENHFLDCEAIQVMGAMIAGAHRWKDKPKPEQATGGRQAKRRRMGSTGVSL